MTVWWVHSLLLSAYYSERRKEAISMATIERQGCGDRDIESHVLWVDHQKHNCWPHLTLRSSRSQPGVTERIWRRACSKKDILKWCLNLWPRSFHTSVVIHAIIKLDIFQFSLNLSMLYLCVLSNAVIIQRGSEVFIINYVIDIRFEWKV